MAVRIKNIGKVNMTFPTGAPFPAGQEITVKDQDWIDLQSNEIIKQWLVAGILLINGAPPPAPVGTPLAILGLSQAEYDALPVKDPNTLYVIPDEV